MIRYKDNVEDWRERIEAALDYRRKYASEHAWAQLEVMFQNLPGSGAEIGPNLIYEMGDALLSRLGVHDADMNIGPSLIDPRSMKTYRTVSALDRWLMGEMEVPSVMQDVILNAYLWHRGIVKIGYDSEWGFDQGFDIGSIQEPLGMTLTQFSKQGKRLEYRMGKPGMPWVAAVLPHDFVVPWGVHHLRDAPWCAHRIIRHIDLLKADAKYVKTRDVQPDRSMKDVIESHLRVTPKQGVKELTAITRNASQRAEFVELWEIHNKVTGEIITISEKFVHRKERDPLQIDGLPFKAMTFIPHPRTFWGTPPAAYLRFHQAEQYDIAIQASNQRRANSLKFLVREGAMEREELEKALSHRVGIAAMMKNSANLDNDIKIMPHGSNFEIWNEAEFSRRNARETAGFSRNQLGEFDQSSRRTATESGLVAQGAEARLGLRQRAVSKLYIDTFRFINQAIFTFWKTPRIVQVAPEEWPQFTGEEIKAEFSYNVAFGVKPPGDLRSQRIEALNFYLQLRGDPNIDQKELALFVSRNYQDPEIDRIFIGAQNAGVPDAVPQLPA